ncbi:penicillin-binding protein [Chryseobacterium gallinarum]|uniref:Penicillin-binding protein n=1 Tax=Chryseobacterium gallinarum TaxID=1324352 RepID=A0A0G3LWF7_CHRGL|nr:hypothetical protein [Chryseobacterium gallinarum]AKK71296.1 penicillin-binding protein [Chryseobacterium gallinarum]
MTRSNLYITLSNGKKITCVLDTNSAPEQGYIVEEIILPLLSFNDDNRELFLIKKHCKLDEKRVNACYRYYIDLCTKEVQLFEEHFNYTTEKFRKGKELTERYTDYLNKINLEK